MRQYYSLLKYTFIIRIAYSGLRLQCVGHIIQIISVPSKAVFTLFYNSLFVIVFTFACPPGFLMQHYNREWGDSFLCVKQISSQTFVSGGGGGETQF